ncbi:MAG TPA: TetR/AcrR family transcriptional regulator [Solirubrobacteraceae bacterium]|nr:TetR/AcrR family transcriptional regulator [Solirubrobacteraceae bacterium]
METVLTRGKAPVRAGRVGRPAAGAEGVGHRDRLIAAMAESVEATSYRETSIADVVRIARTSRSSFYEHFQDRDACYLALFDALNDAVIADIEAATQADRPWQEQVEHAVDAYIAAIGRRPNLWRSFIRELPALGEAGAERQRVVMRRFADLLVQLVEAGLRAQPKRGASPLAPDMGILIAGGITLLMVMALEQGRDLNEVKTTAASAFSAILSETVLRNSPAG